MTALRCLYNDPRSILTGDRFFWTNRNRVIEKLIYMQARWMEHTGFLLWKSRFFGKINTVLVMRDMQKTMDVL